MIIMWLHKRDQLEPLAYSKRMPCICPIGTCKWMEVAVVEKEKYISMLDCVEKVQEAIEDYENTSN